MRFARRHAWFALIVVVATTLLLPAPAASAPEAELVVRRSDGGSVAALKHPKLASQLVMLADAAAQPDVLNVQRALPPELDGALRAGRMRMAGGDVQVFIEVEDIDDVGALLALEAPIERSDATLGIVQAQVPASRLRQLAALASVKRVRLPEYGHVQAGAIQTEGDAVINGDDLRAIAAFDGAGVTVGVISDGVGGLAASQASGDLPAVDTTTCNVIGGDPGAAGAEGTALLEIVHDIAPGADLMFGYFAFGTVLDFNAAVNCLAANADIVVDDIGWFGVGPYDGTSLVSQNTADALNGAGPIKGYYTSVGNEARRHYQGAYVDSGFEVSGGSDDWATHEFAAIDGTVHAGASPAPADSNKILVAPGASASVLLSWDDEWGASGNDYDLLVGIEAVILPCGTDLQDGDDIPLEFCGISNTGEENLEVDVYIGNFEGGASAVNFDLFVLCGCVSHANGNAFDFNTKAGSVPNQSDAGGSPVSVVAVGAVYQGSPATIEGYSSNGPTDDGRPKPDLVAPDGVCITGAGGFAAGNPVCQTSGMQFYGTSASAPHVAAAAALLLDCDSSLSRTSLRSLLVNSAIDLGDAGPDNVYGRGRVNVLASAGLANCGPDSDGDGCVDIREDGDDQMIGGLRDKTNSYDFYDVLGFSGGPPDGVIDLANDILGVIVHFAPTGYTPGTPAVVGAGVYDDFDRSPRIGEFPWNIGPPDGAIDLANDILGVILQFGHQCV